MKSFCLAIACCAALVGTAGAQRAAGAGRPGSAERAGAERRTEERDRVAPQREREEDDAHRRAARGVVQKIYDNNLADSPNETLRVSLDNEMKDLVWQMLLTKGDTMWAAYPAAHAGAEADRQGRDRQAARARRPA